MNDTTPKEYYIEPGISELGAKNEYQVFFQRAKPESVSARAHIHDVVELIHVQEGSFTAFVGGARYELLPGSLLLIRSREIHRIYAGAGENNSYLVVKVDPAVLYDYSDKHLSFKYVLPFKLCSDGKKCCWTAEEAEAAGCAGALAEIIRENSSQGYAGDMAVKILCAKLLLSILRFWHSAGENDNVKYSENLTRLIYRAVEYVHENYSESITAMDCCRHIGLSYSYFSRLFKQIMGKSFKEYLNYLRCNQAERLLITTKLSVSEIATRCGYGDDCYFIFKFREARGTTPSRFRRDFMRSGSTSDETDGQSDAIDTTV